MYRLRLPLLLFPALAVLGPGPANGQPAAPDSFDLPDTRPRLLREHPRPEANDPLLNFNRMEGWAIQSANIEATYERSAARQLWGRFTGHLRLYDGGPESVIRLRPEHPIPVRQQFNRVSFWVHLDPPPDHARILADPRIHAVFSRANGTEFEVHMRLGKVPGWQYHSVPADVPKEDGIRLKGFRFEGLGSPDAPRHLYFDSLAVFTEQRKRIRHESQPARPLDLLNGQLPGRNDSPTQTLGFPALRSGSAPLDDESIEAVFSGEDPPDLAASTFKLNADTPDGHIEYAIDLYRGLDGIRVTWNGHKLGPLLRQASLDGSPPPLQLRSVHRTPKRLRALYEKGLALDFHTRLNGLEILVAFQGGHAKHLRLGPVSDATRTTTLPLWRLSPDANMPVHLLHAGETPLLAAAFLDPFVSNASRLELDAAHYDPLMDGTRNDLFERICLRISPRLADLLPGPSAQPAPKRADIASRLWIGEGSLSLPALSGVPQAGVLPDSIWRDEAGLTCLASEAVMGNAALRDQLAQARAKRLHLALTVDITRLHPLQEHWTENGLARTEHGGWIPGPEGTFLAKSLYFPPAATQLGSMLRDQLSPDGLYALGLAEHPPGKGLDMDERLRGSGSQAQDFFDRGLALQHLGLAADRPVIAPGGGEWRFAGLVDAFDLDRLNDISPYRPLFSRSRLSPNSVLIAPPPEASLEAWCAMVVAYGLHPRASTQSNDRSARRLAHHLLPLQQRTAHLEVETLRYHDGSEGMQSTAEALKNGHLDRSQIHLELAGNIGIWVNGHSLPWEIKVNGFEYRIPSYGWCVSGPEVFSIRGEQEGTPFDYFETPDRRFFDPRGTSIRFRGASGARSFMEIDGKRSDFD